MKKKGIEHKTFDLIFYTFFSETFFVLRRIQRETIINVRRSVCKVPVIVRSLQDRQCTYNVTFRLDFATIDVVEKL